MHVCGVFDLAVQPQTVPPLGAVRAEVAGERPLAGVHAHVLHQLVGCPGQVTAPVAPVLVALAMTLEVNQKLLLPWKRPLADAAAMLRGAILQMGCHGNCWSAAGGGCGGDGRGDGASRSQEGEGGVNDTHTHTHTHTHIPSHTHTHTHTHLTACHLSGVSLRLI